MTNRGARLAALLLLSASVAAPVATAGSPRRSPRHAQVTSARHDTSPSLRDLARTARPAEGHLVAEPTVLDRVGRIVPVTDPVLQTTATTPARLRLVHVYEGLGASYPGFSSGALPPDTVGAAGRTQYVQWVNGAMVVLDKATGTALLGPVPGNTLWAGFGGRCETNDSGDPIVSYDRFADRWVLQQFVGTDVPFGQCVAVSTTPDATGTWHRYAYTYDNLNDYPKAGVWSHSYVTTYAMFGTENGAKVCAMDRAAMLAGSAATQQCFQLGIESGVLLPADAEGTRAPAANADVPLVALATDSVHLYALHVDWRNPANSRLPEPRRLDVAPYTMACGPLYSVTTRNMAACIPQPGLDAGAGPLGLDPISDRPMFRLAWRSFDSHQAMVVTHAVDVPRPTVSGVRWYELRRSGRQPWAVHQQGTFAPDGNARWMSSAAMDRDGGIAVGYSVSGTSVYPGIRLAGRSAGDPPGTLSAETVVVDGSGSQVGAAFLSRWGDYSAMTVDPVDDCTFWYTTEYQTVTGTFNWSTKIAAARLPGCP